MKFAPRRSQIIGRMLIMRSDSTIILIDPSKVSKFILVDAVGDKAEAAGVKVGDIVVPTALGNLILGRGVFRPVLEEENVGFFVTDAKPGEFLVQTETGTQYVPFDSSEAAQPLGSQVTRASEAA